MKEITEDIAKHLNDLKEIYPNVSLSVEQSITLRDQFAIAALQGMLASPLFINKSTDEIAQVCYDMAAAMLKQREVENE